MIDILDEIIYTFLDRKCIVGIFGQMWTFADELGDECLHVVVLRNEGGVSRW